MLYEGYPIAVADFEASCTGGEGTFSARPVMCDHRAMEWLRDVADVLDVRPAEIADDR